MDVEINVMAVVLAVASSMVVGSIWYSKAAFAKPWIKLARIDMTKGSGNPAKPIAISVIIAFITAYVLAHMAYLSNQFFGNSFLQDTLTTAFWLWLGFTALRIVTHDVFEGRPAKLTAITLGNEFVTIMLMGLIIGLMGV